MRSRRCWAGWWIPVVGCSFLSSVDLTWLFLFSLFSGNFADVKLGVDKSTGVKYAIKVIDKTKNWTNPKFFEALEREVKIMMEVQHVRSLTDFPLFPSHSPPSLSAKSGLHRGLL